MERSDFATHKYLLSVYGVDEQVKKTIEDMGRLQQILGDSAGGMTVEPGTMARAIATVAVMLDELSFAFKLIKETEVAKSNVLTEMAISVGMIDAADIEEAKSKRSHKLSPDDVVEIRHAYDSLEASQTELAARYGVTPSIISDVVRGETYKNLEGPISPKKVLSKLSDSQVAEIREKYKAGGISQAALAKEYDVTTGLVNAIVTGRNHRNAPGDIIITGKGHNRITGRQISPETADRILTDFIMQNYSYKKLSEVYNLPPHIIATVFKENGTRTAVERVKFKAVGNITRQFVQGYLNRKGIIKGEVELFLMQKYNPALSLEANLAVVKDFVIAREWNGQTTKACITLLRDAYDRKNRS